MQTTMIATSADRWSTYSVLSSRCHQTLRNPIPFRSAQGRAPQPCRCSNSNDQSTSEDVHRRSVLFGMSAATLLAMQRPVLATDGTLFIYCLFRNSETRSLHCNIQVPTPHSMKAASVTEMSVCDVVYPRQGLSQMTSMISQNTWLKQ